MAGRHATAAHGTEVLKMHVGQYQIWLAKIDGIMLISVICSYRSRRAVWQWIITGCRLVLSGLGESSSARVHAQVLIGSRIAIGMGEQLMIAVDGLAHKVISGLVGHGAITAVTLALIAGSVGLGHPRRTTLGRTVKEHLEPADTEVTGVVLRDKRLVVGQDFVDIPRRTWG